KRGAVTAQAVHLAEAGVAGGTAELPAEQVGDQCIVTELDQLPAKADLEVGDAHHRRDQDHRRPRLVVAPADEDAFQLLAVEIVRDRAVLAHAFSLASSASLLTVFMLRAVPTPRPGCAASSGPCR